MLTREIAISQMLQLKLTPLEPVTSLVHAHAHRDDGLTKWPSSPRRRRAKTLPSTRRQWSSTPDGDADDEGDSGSDCQTKTEIVSQHSRHDHSRVPHAQSLDVKDSDSDSDSYSHSYGYGTSVFLEIWQRQSSYIIEDSEDSDQSLNALVANKPPLGERQRSRPGIWFLNPNLSRQTLDSSDGARRDSGRLGLDSPIAKVYIDGVKYYVPDIYFHHTAPDTQAENTVCESSSSSPQRRKVTFLLGGEGDGGMEDSDTVGAMM